MEKRMYMTQEALAVKQYLDGFCLGDRLQEFEVSSATVELAALALGVEPARIAKTISLQMGEGCVLVVAAGDQKIDNQKFKARFETKAKMLSAEQVEPLTGHKIGGVCPFLYPDCAKVYLDESLRRFDTIYPAGGTPSSAVRLSCEELEECAKSSGWVDVCKTREENPA